MQQGGKARLHAPVVRGQDLGACAIKRKPGRCPALRGAFGVQTVVHSQQQFHAACSRADNGNLARPSACTYGAEHLHPTLVELGDRLDADRMRQRPGHLPGLGRGAGVDGQEVVIERRAALQLHLALCTVDAADLGAHKARTSENAQAHQIQVHRVIVVVAGHVAGQHARVRRVCVGANQGDAQAWHRLHAKGLEHAHMAVPATDQDQVTKNRARARLHAAIVPLRGSSRVANRASA